MAAPQVAGLPPSFVLAGGMQIVLTAIDGTTGNTVSGVNITNVSISVDQHDNPTDLTIITPTPILVPTDI